MGRPSGTLRAAVVLASLAALGLGQSPAGWAEVVQGYRAALGRAGIVGSSLMIVRDGRIVARANEGLQDREAGAPVTDDTIYHWASITKTFTGIAIMQLRDRGLLSLDDPVVKFVPELRLAHDPFGDISQVKIRHLMSHSAGFRASTWPWGGEKPWHPFEPTSWEQIVAMMPYTDVQFAPGSKYSYSNPGVIFLGRVIELLSGDDYEVYVTKNILMPLGMQRTFFDRAPYFLRPYRSHSYVRDDAGLREAPFDFDTGITVSNGGLNAPFGDMARYLAFLSGSGDSAVAATYNTVLKRTSLEEMWTPQIRASEGEGVNGTDSQAALSFFVEHWSNVQLVGHSGDQNGFISHLYLHRPSRTAWAISLNTDTTASKDGSRPSSRQVDMIVRDLIVSKMLH
jgi:CubicO group peptidase (beta-lactamase class C family)